MHSANDWMESSTFEWLSDLTISSIISWRGKAKEEHILVNKIKILLTKEEVFR
jgi:hypothetical protein